MQNTLNLDYDFFSKLIKDAGVFTAGKDQRPAYELVKVFIETGALRLEALDGYRAIRVKAEVDYKGEPFSFYIKPDMLTKGKFDCVEINKEQIRCVSMYLGGEAVFIFKHPNIETDWVDLNLIFPDYKNQKETSKRVGFNLEYLARIAPIIGNVRNRIVRMYFPASEVSPFVLTAKDVSETVNYEFLILPVRITEKSK